MPFVSNLYQETSEKSPGFQEACDPKADVAWPSTLDGLSPV